MLEEGYAAVSTRRVGHKAGLTPQLVHYYFESMDELFLEIFRRRADVGLERFAKALAPDRTLRELWELFSADYEGARFNVEFAALANHRKVVREEMATFLLRYRDLQLDAVTRALNVAGVSTDEWPPMVVLLAMGSIGQDMLVQRELGVTAGHDEMRAFIVRMLGRFDGAGGDERPSRPPRRRGRSAG